MFYQSLTPLTSNESLAEDLMNESIRLNREAKELYKMAQICRDYSITNRARIAERQAMIAEEEAMALLSA